ncbi:hypothetical protein SO802_021703 [Lithocarpus litseifolius]|uniref:RNase H type-1 domain-containing protein n=1 Tax=Lithocarpus litseifolius TaxID=425828 RepID=A0AAW2CFV4_9ROSI
MPIPLSHNVNELKALACRRVVQFACEIGLRKVIFEGDSSVVINALSQGSGCSASYGNIIEDILFFVADFQFFDFCHVKRICNVVADSLAEKAKDL